MPTAKTANKETTTFTTPTDRELVATRIFDAPSDKIWDAHTKPEYVRNWMLGPEGWTLPVCEMDLRPGGAWHFVWRQADGNEMEMRGEFREVKRPERLVRTEEWGGDWSETLNTLVLTEQDGKTRLVTTVLYPSKDEREKAIGTGMKEGWSQSYDRLEKYLRSIT